MASTDYKVMYGENAPNDFGYRIPSTILERMRLRQDIGACAQNAGFERTQDALSIAPGQRGFRLQEYEHHTNHAADARIVIRTYAEPFWEDWGPDQFRAYRKCIDIQASGANQSVLDNFRARMDHYLESRNVQFRPK